MYYFCAAVVGFVLVVVATTLLSVSILRPIAIVAFGFVILAALYKGRRRKSSNAKLAAVLMKFPGPLTFYPSRLQGTLTLGASGIFTGGGIQMIGHDHVSAGWFVLVFFLLVGAVAAINLIPGAGALTLRDRGFEITSLFRRAHVSWQAVENFGTARIPPAISKMVVFDYTGKERSILKTIAVAVAGHQAVLPDTYGFSADDLAFLMMRWREKAVASNLSQAPSS